MDIQNPKRGSTRSQLISPRLFVVTVGPSSTLGETPVPAPGATAPTWTVRRLHTRLGYSDWPTPELLIFGVPPGTAAGILNALGERIVDGEALLPGQLVSLDEWPHRIIPEEVPNPGEIVFGANRFYKRRARHSVPVLQLSYDDVRGQVPLGCRVRRSRDATETRDVQGVTG